MSLSILLIQLICISWIVELPAFSLINNNGRFGWTTKSKSSRIYSTEFTSSSSSSGVFDELRTKLKGTCVYLVGMMGSGKSSTGALFADRLGYRFLDTDTLAEFMVEMPIADFFAQGREAEFRQVEHEVLMELAQYTRLVVATGGGCVLRNDNWGLLRHGVVVHLDVSVNDIYARLSARPEEVSRRPLLRGEDPLARLQALYDERAERYGNADVRVCLPGSVSPEEAAVQVASDILDFIKANPPMWQQWRDKRDAAIVEAAARINPAAVDKANVGFTRADELGSVTYVSMSDIKSGKVKLPYNPTVSNDGNNVSASDSAADSEADNSDKSSGKGFKR